MLIRNLDRLWLEIIHLFHKMRLMATTVDNLFLSISTGSAF